MLELAVRVTSLLALGGLLLTLVCVLTAAVVFRIAEWKVVRADLRRDRQWMGPIIKTAELLRPGEVVILHFDRNRSTPEQFEESVKAVTDWLDTHGHSGTLVWVMEDGLTVESLDRDQMSAAGWIRGDDPLRIREAALDLVEILRSVG